MVTGQQEQGTTSTWTLRPGTPTLRGTCQGAAIGIWANTGTRTWDNMDAGRAVLAAGVLHVYAVRLCGGRLCVDTIRHTNSYKVLVIGGTHRRYIAERA